MRNLRKTVLVCAASLLTIVITAFAPNANAQAPADPSNPYDQTGVWQNTMLDYYFQHGGGDIATSLSHWYGDSVSFSSWWEDFVFGTGYSDYGWYSYNASEYMLENGWPASSAYNMIENYDESGYLITTTQAAYLYQISNLVDSLSAGEVDSITFVGNLGSIESDLLTNMTDTMQVLPLCVLSAVRAGYYYWNAQYADSAAPYVIGQLTAASLQGALFGGVYDGAEALGVGLFLYANTSLIPTDIEKAISASIIAAQTSALYVVTTPPPAPPSARFVEPTDMTSTAVQPTFEIITNYKIDTSSVRWKRVLIDDSTKVQVPTICVLPYPSYSSFDTLSFADTIWALIADTGTGTIINDTTIEFQASILPNSQLFEAVLMGLRVINTAGDTITIPDTVARISFTTIALPPRLQTLSIFQSNSVIRAADTLTASFTTKLDSASCVAGPLVSIVIRRPSMSDSIVASTVWLDATDSTKLHILPNNTLTPGQNYAMKIGLSNLTGDSTQDRTWLFNCRKSFRLNITAAPTTDSLTYLSTIHFDPAINENYKIQYDSSIDSGTMVVTYDTTVVYDSSYIGRIVNANDTVTYTAPIQVGGAVFQQWSGSGLASIDTSTNPMLAIFQTADQLHDVHIVALYRPVTVNTVCVATAGTNTDSDFVEVQSDSQDCHSTIFDTCASTSSVNYTLEQGKAVMLSAFSTSDTIQFDHWESTDTNINGETAPTVMYRPSGSSCVTANFSYLPTPPSPPTPNELIYVRVYNLTTSQWVQTTGGIATILAPYSVSDGRTWADGSQEDLTVTTTLRLSDPSYGLEYYSISYNTPPSTGHHEYFGMNVIWPATWNYTIPAPYVTSTSKKPTYVTFYIIKVSQLLTIEETLDDDNPVPTPNLFVYPTPDPDPAPTSAPQKWCYVDTKPISLSGNIPYNDATASPAHPHSIIYQLTYPNGTTINLACKTGTNSGYTFLHWDASQPPNTDPTGTPPYTNPNLTLTMDQDRYVTAAFHEPLKLVSITFNQDVGSGSTRTTKSVTIPADEWGDQQTNLTDGLPWTNSSPLTLTLHFNRPIENLSSPSTYITYDASPNWTASYSLVHQDAYQSNNSNDQDITVTLGATGSGTSLPVWKGQTGNIYVGVDNTITDEDGYPLSNPGTFAFSTVGPDVNWEIQWFWPMGVCDEGILSALFPSLFIPQLDNFYTHGLGYYATSSTSDPTLSTFGWPYVGGNQSVDCDNSTIPSTSGGGFQAYYGFDISKVSLDGLMGMRTDGFTSQGGCEGANISSAVDFLGYVLAIPGWSLYFAFGPALMLFPTVAQMVADNIGLSSFLLLYEEFTGSGGCGRYIGFSNWPQVGIANFWGYWLNDDGIYGDIPDPDWATPYGYGDYGALKSHVNVTVQ